MYSEWVSIPEPNIVFSRLVGGFRTLAGFTRAQAASKFGINEKEIVKMELGSRPISNLYIRRLGDSLEGVDRRLFEEAFLAHMWKRPWLNEVPIQREGVDLRFKEFNECYEGGQISGSLRRCKKFYLSLVQSASYPHDSLRAIQLISHWNLHLGNPKLAFDIARESRNQARAQNDSNAFAWALLRMAIASRFAPPYGFDGTPENPQPEDALQRLESVESYIATKKESELTKGQRLVLRNLIYREQLATMINFSIRSNDEFSMLPHFRKEAQRTLTKLEKARQNLVMDSRVQRSMDVELQAKIFLGKPIKSEYAMDMIVPLADPGLNVPVAISRYRTMFYYFIADKQVDNASRLLRQGLSLAHRHNLRLAVSGFSRLAAKYFPEMEFPELRPVQTELELNND